MDWHSNNPGKGLDIVKVWWLDSSGSGHWQQIEDIDTKLTQVVSVGLVYEYADDSITIMQNYGLNPPQACGVMTIPRSAITKIEYIGKVEV